MSLVACHSDQTPKTGTETISIYAINDFHGALNYDNYYDEPGLAKVATYLKSKKEVDPDKTIILSSGDMWQGTYESYHNRGRVITEAMNKIGFDSMTIGNHEFDWGAEDILYNEQYADFPILGANIMEYPNTSVKSEIGEEYVILNRGDLKIGIIGVIGQEQITSINSRYVEDIYFADPTPIIKNLSTKLRNVEKVDIVILSIHAGQGDVDSSIPNGKYVDAIFCAHTHRDEKKIVNGVPFIQGGTKGQHVSEVKLSYDYETKKTSLVSYSNSSTQAISKLVMNSEAQTLIDQYAASSNEDGNRKVGTLTDELDNYSTLPNLANYAAALKAQDLGYTIDLTMTNVGRESIPSGDINYRDLFKGIPFDNYIYIVRATGRDIKNEALYNYVYRVSDLLSADYENNEYYTIAVIDYVVLHQNINKQYNYFPSYNPTTDFIDFLKDDEDNPFYPRDLIEEIFASNLDHTLNPNDYTGVRYSL